MDVISLKVAVDWLVGLSGFFVWILFIPQIKLLLEVKESRSNSIWASVLSGGLQMLILLQALLNSNWALFFTTTVSVVFVAIVLVIILYYRKFPGGRI
jgi:hypothetical protein